MFPVQLFVQKQCLTSRRYRECEIVWSGRVCPRCHGNIRVQSVYATWVFNTVIAFASNDQHIIVGAVRDTNKTKANYKPNHFYHAMLLELNRLTSVLG